jgi:nucleoside-diphosphate-sugar epimerase
MRVLVTGAAGFLGRRLVSSLEENHQLRLVDVNSVETEHESLVGDVSDFATAKKVLRGVDGVVIAHMAPRDAGPYTDPETAFDANVTGTACLFQAAVEEGVRRICLISITGSVKGHPEGAFYTRSLTPRGWDLYSLTKACQEVIAEHYHRTHGLDVAVLRVGGIVDADTGMTKYGSPSRGPAGTIVDRRDIGEVARLSLELDDLEFEVFYVYGSLDADRFCDFAYSRKRLGWSPRYPC